MTEIHRPAALAATALALSALLGCGNMDHRDRSTAAGAAIGGAAGAVLGGNTAATVGGAVVGGVIGNQVGKDNK